LPLRWFRRKRNEESAPTEAAAPAPEPLIEIADEPAEEAQAAGAETTDTEAKKRRRGTRGGRNRKKKPATTNGASADEEEAKSATAAAKKAAERKQPAANKQSGDTPAEKKQSGDGKARTRSTRRTPAKRPPLPKAKRELLVSVDAGEKRVAVLEDDQVAEVYLERPEKRSIAGNIYLGVVDNVLPGMEAAFVEIGLEKNGFLYVDEIVGPELEGRKGARKIQDLIQRGQTLLVQAVKDPMKTKGARLTTEISLPGRFVVYVPHGDGLGVSRRLEDDERARLKAILKEIAPKDGGVIVRTAAEGASAEDVARDLDFLQRLWKTIEAQANGKKAPALIYQEAELPLRVTRDLFTGDFERLIVDHDRTHKRIVGYLKKTSPHMVDRVFRHKEREPLMEALGVEQQIRSTLNRRVDLPSGGYLIFDYAEAFTVIDVNTGRYVGSRSKKSGGRLEDTITKNNLEAVKEVVRQLRLRDVGGIIVIDFIDMANPKNRAQVEDALRSELERDRTKTYVVEISPLGLVEMTRQNVTDGPREVMTRKCPTCDGDGIVVSETTTAVAIERKLRSLVTPGSRAKAFKVELNAKIASMVAGPGASRLRELEDVTKRKFFFVGKDGVHLDHFVVLEQGTLAKVAPTAGVEEGQELVLEPGEVGLYDPQAGVAKRDGVDVRVGGAAKLVGKKVKARITAVMDGVAYAELVEGPADADLPITAEGEAEKPTRARRAPAKKAGADDAVAGEPEAEEADDVEAAADPEDDAEAAEGDLAADGAPKKRTRRGTRGGRNRKKKAPVDGAGDADGDAPVDDAAPALDAESGPEETAHEDAPSEEDVAPSVPAIHAPVIHVPDRDLGREDDDAVADTADAANGDAPAPEKKKTRRGTRGGRNRRKKPAAATVETDDAAAAVATVEADEPSEPVEPVEAGAPAVEEASAADEQPQGTGDGDGEADWTYTPMSEWGIEDDRA
jgi:ribonuclease G